jgi:predicted GNAT family N-acyltransferase
MAKPTIKHLPPPGDTISTYNTTVPPTAQTTPLPQLFLDAMLVRTAVFVGEQAVPMPREHDADDARAHHWIAYAPAPSEDEEAAAAEPQPVGTIRAVPPDPPAREGEPPAEWPPHPTVHAGEAYVRLGRLATLASERGRGVGRLLVETVLAFLARPGAAAEMAGGGGPAWGGLVVVHAQRDRSVEYWRRFGFAVDEGMGEWDEEGMLHVGMYRRVGVEEKQEPVSVHAWLLDQWDENVG